MMVLLPRLNSPRMTSVKGSEERFSMMLSQFLSSLMKSLPRMPAMSGSSIIFRILERIVSISSAAERLL